MWRNTIPQIYSALATFFRGQTGYLIKKQESGRDDVRGKILGRPILPYSTFSLFLSLTPCSEHLTRQDRSSPVAVVSADPILSHRINEILYQI
jgi:hypothetical protein